MRLDQDPPDRTALLEFVELHWRELTLRDARSLCLESVDGSRGIEAVKTTLTCR
jgi:hypothetical protein